MPRSSVWGLLWNVVALLWRCCVCVSRLVAQSARRGQKHTRTALKAHSPEKRVDTSCRATTEKWRSPTAPEAPRDREGIMHLRLITALDKRSTRFVLNRRRVSHSLGREITHVLRHCDCQEIRPYRTCLWATAVHDLCGSSSRLAGECSELQHSKTVIRLSQKKKNRDRCVCPKPMMEILRC